MNKIQSFALKHAVIYCIIAEFLVLGGMMLAGTGISLVVYVVMGLDVDYYVLMAAQELCGALIALGAIAVSGCGDIFTRRGIGFFKGLGVGGYFLFISAYSAVVLFATFQGARVLKPWHAIAAFVVCMLLVGMTEEFLCRGVLVQCVSAAVLGMAFAAIYFRTGCIWVTVVLHALVDIAALITNGLYTGTVEEVISEYTPANLIGVVPYVIVVLVLLRQKKMDEIVKRYAAEERPRPQEPFARPDLDWMR